MRMSCTEIHDGPGIINRKVPGTMVGFCAVAHSTPHPKVPADAEGPEGWVRGTAALDKTTGVVTIAMQLESDSALQGPKGAMVVHLRDSSGKEIGSIKVGEVERGGKRTGKAEDDLVNLHGQVTVSKEAASRTASVDVSVKYTGAHFGPWVLEDIIGAAKMVVEILTS